MDKPAQLVRIHCGEAAPMAANRRICLRRNPRVQHQERLYIRSEISADGSCVCAAVDPDAWKRSVTLQGGWGMSMDGLSDSVRLLLRELDGFMSRLARWLYYREWSSGDMGFVGLLIAVATAIWLVLRAARAKRVERRHAADHLEI